MRYEELYKKDPYAYLLLWGAMSREGMLPVGTRVVPTEWALQNGVGKPGDVAVIKGHGRGTYTVRVLKNGRKHPCSYWSGFWRDINFKP